VTPSVVGLAVVGVCLAAAACDKKSAPAPPTVDSPAAPEAINGSERLGWQQSASDAIELGAFRYAIYVDDARSELTGAACAQSATDFACTARLPSMSPGAHTLQLATFVVDGSVLESARSAALRVTVTAASTTSHPSSLRWPTDAIVTGDGVRLRLERVDGLSEPTDLAFAPDGRLFVAEKEGRIRVIREGSLLAEPALSLRTDALGAGELLALAVDPHFDRTHFVYAIYTMASQGREPSFSVARFREASNTLADRVTLLDGVRASAERPAAALRFGADGKLFAAFDDGGRPELADDPASTSGKLLRLNTDGTTPGDQAGGTPIYSFAYHSPVGFDWQPTSNILWLADRGSSGSGRLSAVVEEGAPRKRGVARVSVALPQGELASSLAFYRGASIPAFRDNLLIASDEGRHLTRLRFDAREPMHVVATEHLLQDRIGGVRLVAIGPDGAIYLGTAHAIGKLTPVD
jgi:glucose/arabinose dehydrogenase